MKRRNTMAALAICLLLTAGCSGANDGRTESTTAVPPSAVDTSADPTRADADLILTMYDDINTAFQANPDDGVRAIIASQYPDDLADVDFARCVAAIEPGATTLPPTQETAFRPEHHHHEPRPRIHRDIGPREESASAGTHLCHRHSDQRRNETHCPPTPSGHPQWQGLSVLGMLTRPLRPQCTS